MEQITTYIIKSKLNGYIWRFKYHLNGGFISFEILEGTLNTNQVFWLFGGLDQNKQYQPAKFPILESTIKVWQKLLSKNFEITIEAPALTFEALWNLYNYKIKKVESEKFFNKLKEADVIKLFLEVPKYNKYMTTKTHDKAHLSTFINKRMFEDDFSKI